MRWPSAILDCDFVRCHGLLQAGTKKRPPAEQRNWSCGSRRQGIVAVEKQIWPESRDRDDRYHPLQTARRRISHDRPPRGEVGVLTWKHSRRPSPAARCERCGSVTRRSDRAEGIVTLASVDQPEVTHRRIMAITQSDDRTSLAAKC